MRIPTVGTGASLTLACFNSSFPPIGLLYPALIGGLLFCLIVSCFVLSSCHFLETCSFLKRRSWGNGHDRKGRWVGAARKRVLRGSCCWDVLCEKAIYFQFKKFKNALLFFFSKLCLRNNDSILHCTFNFQVNIGN